MKVINLYFDTSIFNFALAEEEQDKMKVTLQLLEKVKAKEFKAYISEVVLREIKAASKSKAERLIKVIKRIPLKELKVTAEARKLALKYVAKGIIPKKYEADALHIAIASINKMDVLVSWNFEHIVKLKTKIETGNINLSMGYKVIDIYSPWEVV